MSPKSIVHVSLDINGSRQLLNLNFKSLLNFFQDFQVLGPTHESNGQSLSSEPSSSSDSVKVGIRILRHVIVEDHIDLLNIDSSSEDVCSHHNPVLELLEVIVSLDSIEIKKLIFVKIFEGLPFFL